MEKPSIKLLKFYIQLKAKFFEQSKTSDNQDMKSALLVYYLLIELRILGITGFLVTY